MIMPHLGTLAVPMEASTAVIIRWSAAGLTGKMVDAENLRMKMAAYALQMAVPGQR